MKLDQIMLSIRCCRGRRLCSGDGCVVALASIQASSSFPCSLSLQICLVLGAKCSVVGQLLQWVES